MTIHTLTGTVTDTMAATDTDTATINSVAAADPRTVRRSFMTNRIMWGSAIDSSVRGPFFTDTAPITDYTPGRTTPGAAITLGMIFRVLTPARFVGCRIYKAPNAVATSVPVTLWQSSDFSVTQASTGTVLDTATTGPWVVDGGGWRDVTFSTPVTLTPGNSYIVGYYSADGIYSFTPWIWHAQDTCVWPLFNKCLQETTVLGPFEGTCNSAWDAPPEAGITFPRRHLATSYYIDPVVEWDEPLPDAFNGDTDYYGQWMSPFTRHAFPFGIWYCDPPFIQEYYDMGVNALFGGFPHLQHVPGNNSQEYLDEMAATGTGHSMDWWPSIAPDLLSLTFNPSSTLVQMISEDPDLADQVMGYNLWDEPDLTINYRSPALMREWANKMRACDSTRPIWFNFGAFMAVNQGFWGAPTGASMQTLNEYWREWAELTDIVSLDQYQWFETNGMGWPGNGGGVWVYAAQVGRCREVSDDRKPVWGIVETTSQSPDGVDPVNVVKSIWACLIAGARGIVLFDHRFGSNLVTQDFAHMLHVPAMKSAVTALIAQVMPLGPALLGPDLGLITATTSSNTTAGPIGGTYGTPLHYTTRSDGTYEYAFVQAIRPGATTGTITIPTWASEVVDVLDEARTETVSVGGVITDTFAADYQYHLYRRTL